MTEQQKVNELMKPRYKVIADYPKSCFTIDEVVHGESIFGIEVKNYSEFPAIFRKLEWWEERNIEDMPKYVKYVSDGKVYEAIKYLDRNSLVLLMDDYWKIEIRNELGEPFWMPATSHDYENYLKSKI